MDRTWRVGFQLSTLVGVIFLILLLLNIINLSVGYIAMGNEVDPPTLTDSGLELDELTQAELVMITSENVSAGLLRQLEREGSLEERNRNEVYALVLEKVVKPEVATTWSLFDSIFKQKSVGI